MELRRRHPEVKGFAPGAPVVRSAVAEPCAGERLPLLQYGGTYTVTLTITDVAGNIDSVTHEVTVDGPPPPGSAALRRIRRFASAGPPAPGSGGCSGAGATSAVANPVAAAAVVSRSLKNAHQERRRRRLLGQRAGRGPLRGPDLAHARAQAEDRAAPRPRACPPARRRQMVIAKALLVTTKGGHSTY